MCVCVCVCVCVCGCVGGRGEVRAAVGGDIPYSGAVVCGELGGVAVWSL